MMTKLWYFAQMEVMPKAPHTHPLPPHNHARLPPCNLHKPAMQPIGIDECVFGGVAVFGPDVVSTLDSPKKPRNYSAGPRSACQKAEDKIWKINHIALNLHPKSCPANAPRCNQTLIHFRIRSIEDYEQNGGTNQYSDTKEELMKECKPPREALSDWHAKYWDACKYFFKDSTRLYWIQFRGGGGMYPPEDIEHTKNVVLRMIEEYRIN